MINFNDFSKEEIVWAAENMLELNLLPSLEEYLVRGMHLRKHERLTDKYNTLVNKYNVLPQRSADAKRAKADMYKKIQIVQKQLNEHFEKLLECKIIDQKEYDELLIKHG